LCLEIKERPFLYAMAICFVVCEERNEKSVCDRERNMLGGPTLEEDLILHMLTAKFDCRFMYCSDLV
jgi:hypothetical protein